MAFGRLLACSLLGTCLLACDATTGDDDGFGPGGMFREDRPDGTLHEDLDCELGLEICNVQERSCRERLFAATACQRRQLKGDMPEIREITSEEFREELNTDIGVDAPANAWDVALGLLGLITPSSNTGGGTVDALVEGVLGFYDARTQEVTLLSDATGLDDTDKVVVLSHEFVHVLQDRSEGLMQFDRPRVPSDQAVANDALTEGEAVLHSNVALQAGDGIAATQLDWESYYDGMLDGILGAIDRARSPFIEAMLQLPYPVGGRTVTQIWLDAGQRALNRMYDVDRVTSLSSWQREYPAVLDPPPGGLACDFPTVPEGYTGFGNDIFGVAGITALWSAHSEGGAAEGWEQGRAWRAGRTLVFKKGGDEQSAPEGVLLVWHIVWSSRAAATEVETLLADTDIFVQVRDRASIVAVTDDPDLTSWIEEEADVWLDCQRVEERRKALTAPARPWWRGTDRHWFTRGMARAARHARRRVGPGATRHASH